MSELNKALLVELDKSYQKYKNSPGIEAKLEARKPLLEIVKQAIRPAMPDLPPVDRSNIKLPTTQATRQKANDAAIELLSRIEFGGLTRADLTDAEIETLAKYTGNGGGIKNKEGDKGSQYEYYTPKEIASGMWDLAAELGFKGGTVLDPSSGTGLFTSTSPDNAIVDSVELDETSGGIARILNDGERSHTVVNPFEKEAGRVADDSLDMVITNVPFGDKSARGANRFKDDAYQEESIENYFILRSLEKIKPGGLAVFITPTAVMTGKEAGNQKLRQKTSLKAELLGAYRLPTSVFKDTAADVVTDVVVYRKYSADAADKVNDLYAAGDIDTLTRAGVLWDEYLDGKYFKKSGKKFVLGDVVDAKDRYGKMSETVVSTKATPEIAKMMRKFGDSRINWALLDATEAPVIEYKNGDTVFQNGKQLKYKDGGWEVMAKEVTDTDTNMHALLAKMGNSYQIAVNGVTWDDVLAVQEYCKQTGQRSLIPSNVEALIAKTINSRVERNSIGAAWQAITLGDAMDKLILEHGYNGYDYKSSEPVLSDVMKSVYLDGKNSKLKGDAATALKLIGLHYNKGDYSDTWLGKMTTAVEDSAGSENYKNKLARIQYENKSLYLSREQLKEVHPDLDPMTDDDWFVSSDGSQVIHADDFLIGTLGARLKDIDAQIAAATDDAIKAKLIRQKTVARSKITPINFRKMQYDLRSPLIDAATKVAFLKQFVHSAALITYDDNGKARADINATINDKKPETEKLYNRIGDWIKTGTVTLGGIKLSMSDREALDWLADRINKANVEFNAWVRANDVLMNTLDAKGNAPENLYFSQNADDAPIDIAGMNPKLSLHGYQNEFVRKQGRMFGGINGFGVGLGKTFTGLASVQHVHNIGTKKKTIFVVPNSVLSNWRKEATFAYENTDDCLYVGLREKDGKFKVYSNKYDEDLLAAIDGKYRKIFMTFEAFRRIRLKEDSIEGYARYLQNTDNAYSSKELKKEGEKAKGLVDELLKTIKIDSSAPYLEDMNIDSVVVDEAHAFKNSITAPNTNDRVKYLSLASTSDRGEDAQAKLWYIRGQSPNKDGVQLLSATPITNSPLEIYSMLALAGGREMVNSMAGGVMGADEFLQVMCQIEEEVLPTIDGKERSQNVFTGIRNVQMLRHAIKSMATIKDAKDVGLSVVIPDREETATNVTLSDDSKAMLETYQMAYQYAKALVNAEKNGGRPELTNDEQLNQKMQAAYRSVSDLYKEEDELMAHPFNLIRKMDVLIADEDFRQQATFYDFEPAQKERAQKVIDDFNKKSPTDDRPRLSVFTNPEDATAIYRKDGDKELIGYKVTVRSKIVLDSGRERIMIDTLNGKVQANFEAIADKNKLNLDVTVSAKIAAMLENFKTELSNPRGVNSDGTNSHIVKQIIFCDHLFLHNKIKKLLTKQAGIPASKIAIITGQVNNEPDQMIDVQDGFNAETDDNVYQVIIANQKAEVGINLQKGTQAIHHLTTGWTPDSLEQRNGRGARQGNKTDKVTIYHYDADGTFDEFKRTMINKKDEWISSLLSSDDKNTVAVSGGISKEDQEALISIGSDKDAIQKYQAEKDAKEAQTRADNAKRRQSISLGIIKTQRDILEKTSVDTIYHNDIKAVVDVIRDNRKNASENASKKAAEKYLITRKATVEKLGKILNSIEARHTENKDVKKEINITPDGLYQAIEDDFQKFSPGKRDDNWNGWVKTFSGIIFKKVEFGFGEKRDEFNIVISEDSDYQAQYDGTIDQAKKMITESGKAIDEISQDMGGLPVGAGEKIAAGTAKINNGEYIEAGAIVVYEDNSLSVIDNDFIARRCDAVRGKTNASMPKKDVDKVILSSDPKYLDYVKKLAAAEDELYAAGKLKEAYYSSMIPAVVDYRDGDIIPTISMPTSLWGEQPKIVNGPLEFIAPVSVLDVDTPFANKLKSDYEKAGISINLNDKSFKVNKDAIASIEGTISILRSNKLESLITPLVDYIKGNDIRLAQGDKIIDYVSETQFIVELINVTKNDVKDKISQTMDDVIQKRYDALDGVIPKSMDFIDDAIKIFDDYLLPHAAFESHAISESDKIKVLGCYVDTPNILGNKDAATHMNERFKVLAKVNEKPLADDDAVNITGNTFANKDKIQSYANKYGTEVKSGKKYCWNPNEKCWTIAYGAFKKLIEDYPSLENDLNIEKAS